MTSHSSRIVLAGVILVLASGLGSAQSTGQQQSAADLAKTVIYNELHPSSVSDVHWKYRLEKTSDGKQETREVVETKSGSIDKLLLVAGRRLTGAQERDEAQRVLHFSQSPEQQRKAEQARRKDAEQCNSLMQMIPNAFIFEYAAQEGDLAKITFKPNPRFQPPSREGQLMNEVKFGGGLLGHLEKGGQFTVKRAEVAAGDWEVTELNVNMHGKALLLKSISVQQKEVHSNFERVPEDLTLADAANLLLKQTLVAEKQ